MEDVSEFRDQTTGEAPRIVIVGGGIAGLAAGARLREELPQAQITVLEADGQIGGKLKLGTIAGLTIDVGAEAMLNRRPEAVALTRASGLGEDLVYPATTAASLWNRGALVPMPKTLMGIPGDLKALGESGVLSAAGLGRAAMDAVLPASTVEGDISVGDLVEERFGREVVDRLVEPLLGGVYAGHARELSLRAAVPQILGLLASERSLGKAAADALSGPASEVPIFAGIRGGVGRLPAAVAQAFALEVRTRATVRDLVRRQDGGWRLVVGPANAPELVDADAVVLATPARPTARLLSDVVPDAALELARVDYASVAVITYAFRAADFPEVVGSGFLVPPVDGRLVKASTYSFAKWDWVREVGAEDGLLVLRCSVGRYREEAPLQADDDTLVAAALADLREAIGVEATPVEAQVQRWGGGLPQYAVGHAERMAAVLDAVAAVPGLAVCGAVYQGVGIPACIASGQDAAAQILSSLRQPV